jgi:hypothetical protein
MILVVVVLKNEKLSPKPQPWFTPTISSHQLLLGILFFPNIKIDPRQWVAFSFGLEF